MRALAVKLRKVQEVGRGTLVISLPKAWARRLGVRKGTILAVSETALGQLIIEPFLDEEEGPTSTVVRCDGRSPEEVGWTIIGAYLLGYDTVEVVASSRISASVKSTIRRVVRGLVGLEIVEEDLRRVVLNCLVNPSAVDLKTLLARKSAITKSMHSDAVLALSTGDHALAEMVVDRDEEVDRLYFLIVRLLRSAIRDLKLAERFGLTPVDCLDYRMAAKLIESIGDHAVEIASLVLKLPPHSSLKAISGALSRAEDLLKEMQDLAVKAFLGRRAELVGRVKGMLTAALGKAIRSVRDGAGLLGELGPVALSAAHLMHEIGKCCVDIADLVVPAGLELR